MLKPLFILYQFALQPICIARQRPSCVINSDFRFLPSSMVRPDASKDRHKFDARTRTHAALEPSFSFWPGWQSPQSMSAKP